MRPISLYNRYNVLKQKEPDYLLLFIVKDKYNSYGIDKIILSSLKRRRDIKYQLQKLNISYLVVDNLTIISRHDSKNNQYSKIYLKVAIQEVLHKLLGKY